MAYGKVNADVIGTSVANSNIGAKNASTLQNRLINAGFTINQRGYVSGTALSASTYAHDRFKAGASGCTYTFTQLSTGVPIVITITAGSLQQVIEGCNMPEGGTYILSWTGTAQARFNGGTYGSSPLAVTGITAGANTTIEFNAGTLSYPQLEVGTSATGFEYRQYGTELSLCQRYYQKTFDAGTAPIQNSGNYAGAITSLNAGSSFIGNCVMIWRFLVSMRAIPTVTIYTVGPNVSFPNCIYDSSGTYSSLTSLGIGTNSVSYYNSGNALGANSFSYMQASASAEL